MTDSITIKGTLEHMDGWLWGLHHGDDFEPLNYHLGEVLELLEKYEGKEVRITLTIRAS